MVRKFGVKNTSRAGTGTFEKDIDVSNSEKWTSAAASQLVDNKAKSVLVKSLPITHIKTDQDNPRKLAIDVSLLIDIQKSIPIKTYLKNEEDNEWIEDYVKQVTKEFNLKGKQIGDFTSIVEFASVLRSPKRLLHSVVVWQEDSIFHLISGERRLLTHVLLGAEYISSRITEEKLTKNEINILQWEENIHREDMTLFEKTTRLEKLIKDIPKISVRKLAKLSGLSVAESQRYLVIIRYPTNTLINAIEEGKVEGLQKSAALAQLPDIELKKILLGNNPTKKEVLKPTIKISKDADNDVMNKIISAITKEYNAESVLEKLDLSKSKDINIALNSLVAFLKEKN